jgi:hypothetical protein
VGPLDGGTVEGTARGKGNGLAVGGSTVVLVDGDKEETAVGNGLGWA